MTAKNSVASQMSSRTRRMDTSTVVRTFAASQARVRGPGAPGIVPAPIASQGHNPTRGGRAWGLRKPPRPTTLVSVSETFKGFEATSFFCACSECGSQVGGKTDNDATDFYTPAPAPRRNAPRRG